MKSRRAIVWVPVLIVLGLLGAGVAVWKPKWLHGESKRAEASVQATAAVATAVVKTDDAQNAKAALAAASVQAIQTANAAAPASPSKTFIERETPVALAQLPPPDANALLEAEKRRSAVMEGRVAEANELYDREAKHSAELQKDLTAAIAQREAAFAERRKADEAISQAAAEHLAQERTTNIVIALAVLASAGWIYTKLTHLSPSGIGNLAKDIRAGFDPLTALDIHTPPWIHADAQKVVKMAANIDQPPTPKQ